MLGVEFIFSFSIRYLELMCEAMLTVRENSSNWSRSNWSRLRQEVYSTRMSKDLSEMEDIKKTFS